MIVEMGNGTPHQCVTHDGGAHSHVLLEHGEPAVYAWADGGGCTNAAAGMDGREAGLHVLTNGVTHLPDQEAFVSIVSDWPHHSAVPPTWVVCTPQGDEPQAEADDLARMLSEFYGCPVGRPDDLEATHHTMNGPPGVGPAVETEG